MRAYPIEVVVKWKLDHQDAWTSKDCFGYIPHKQKEAHFELKFSIENMVHLKEFDLVLESMCDME